ncbi:MAG: hypothetical protein FJ344_03185 [Sphingomonadales bacterium]|nr:hypothetical protein [Sphingomonadales bacterium]
MDEIEIQEPPVKKPKTRVSKSVQRKLKESLQAEGQVVVHCSLRPPVFGTLIRIWKSTFLIPKGTDLRCPMLYWENITLHPRWMKIPGGKGHRFTLIFAPLPSSCTLFNLEEIIPEPGGFSIQNISRNDSDVYHVELD